MSAREHGDPSERNAMKDVTVNRHRQWEATEYEIRLGDEEYARVPSVTTVLKSWPAPQLERWKLKQVAAAWRDDRDKLGYSDLNRLISIAIDKTAANRGTACHRAVETSLSGGTPDKEWWSVTGPVREALKEAGVQVTLQEAVVVDRDNGYAGSADMLGRDADDRPVVLDLKTGRNLWDNHWAQVHAYAHAAELVVGRRIHPMPDGMRAALVHAPLSGPVTQPILDTKPTVVWMDNEDRYRRQWELALAVHTHIRQSR